jgi:hypothetical protein
MKTWSLLHALCRLKSDFIQRSETYIHNAMEYIARGGRAVDRDAHRILIEETHGELKVWRWITIFILMAVKIRIVVVYILTLRSLVDCYESFGGHPVSVYREQKSWI